MQKTRMTREGVYCLFLYGTFIGICIFTSNRDTSQTLPYWLEHALLSLFMTLVLLGLFMCTNATQKGGASMQGVQSWQLAAAAVFPLGFYVGREIRDYEKLEEGMDWPGLLAPVVTFLLVSAGAVFFFPFPPSSSSASSLPGSYGSYSSL